MTQALSSEQIATYRRDGFIGPLRWGSAQEAAALVVALDEVLRRPGVVTPAEARGRDGRLSSILQRVDSPDPTPYTECRHLDSPQVWALCAHPAVLCVARRIYGPDLLVWRSSLIEKVAGTPEFRWHQDWGGVFRRGDDYGLEPPLHFSAWLALTPADEENGCVFFIPGTRAVLPTVPASEAPGASALVAGSRIDERRAVPMRLSPGEFVLFSDRVVHGSPPNRSGARRLALAVRYTLPMVAVRPHFSGHRVILACGEDRVGVNPLARPPVGGERS